MSVDLGKLFLFGGLAFGVLFLAVEVLNKGAVVFEDMAFQFFGDQLEHFGVGVFAPGNHRLVQLFKLVLEGLVIGLMFGKFREMAFCH